MARNRPNFFFDLHLHLELELELELLRRAFEELLLIDRIQCRSWAYALTKTNRCCGGTSWKSAGDWYLQPTENLNFS